MNKTGVFVVDDSAVVRQVVSEIIGKAPDLRLVGAAPDPLYALERMQREWPDVIVLDVEMPRMDGITFLKKIMAERPTPVVICSTLTEKNTETSLQALAAGAVEIVAKPKMGLKRFLEDSAAALLDAIKAAAQARVGRVRPAPAPAAIKVAPKLSADAVLAPLAGSQAMAETTERIVAIGTSTGGTQALEAVLKALPRVCPGLVIVQHMPEKFTAAFAARLDALCAIEVREAQAKDRVIPGRALIAPGGRHMLLKRSGAHYHVDVVDGPLVSRHRPSVDVLFRSVAKIAGRNALGIIMTGMGDDGAAGLKEMRDAGARTLGQDEASCVVYGMPKEAVKRGAVERSVALSELAQEIARAQ
ncbi:MAG TPA: chemotaxis response regulator protein-glutamate methylesterase [Gammaproteobacteria bacterium]|nr:chemotaxis response regulator protein-glutamate methylesterase [Gammaproteobacteria bacterium]